MRRKEIADLRWKCVNLGNRNVFLPETKNNEASTFPLSPRALAVLRELPRSIDEKSVFNLSEDQITTAMKLARNKAKLDAFASMTFAMRPSGLQVTKLPWPSTNACFALPSVQVKEKNTL